LLCTSQKKEAVINLNALFMEKDNNVNIYGALLAFVGIFMFSAKAIFVKLVYEFGVDSITVLAYRMIFSLPIYIAIWLAYRKKEMKKNNTHFKTFFAVIPLGIMGYYLASFLDFEGLVYIDASMERLIVFIYPTLVLLLGFLLFKRRIMRNQVVAIAIAYIGIAIAFGNKIDFNEQNNILLGSVFVFGSTLSYAIYLVFSEKYIQKIGTVVFTSLSMIVSCIAVLTHYYFSYGFTLFQHSFEVYLYTFLMSIFCTVIPSFMITQSIKMIGSSNMAILGSVGPISTMILAVIFLNEVITAYQIAGTVVVILGVLMLKGNAGFSSVKFRKIFYALGNK